MPVLLNGDLSPGRKLRASSLSLTEEAAGPGEARLVLQAGERLRVRDPVLLFGPEGSAGIWFVRAVTLDAETDGMTAELAGGLSSLADDCLPDEDLVLSGSFASVVSRLLACQSERPGAGRLWAPGACEIGESVLLEAGGRDLLSCLLALFSEFPEYRMETDQSALPWRISFRRADAEAPAEGRLARNLESLRIRRDDSLLCTRVVSEALPGGFLDGEAAETYGVVAEAVPLPEDADGAHVLNAKGAKTGFCRDPLDGWQCFAPLNGVCYDLSHRPLPADGPPFPGDLEREVSFAVFLPCASEEEAKALAESRGGAILLACSKPEKGANP